jgi:hypothetical protein
LSGGISAGFSYAKGNNETSYNVNGNLNAKTSSHDFLLSLSSTFTGQPGGQGTDRNDLNLQYWKSLSRNWLVGSYNDFLSSQEQELESYLDHDLYGSSLYQRALQARAGTQPARQR